MSFFLIFPPFLFVVAVVFIFSYELANEMIFINVFLVNDTYSEHLKSVVCEMKKRGSPFLRAYVCRGGYCLCEGSHRASAAKELGLNIYLSMLSFEDRIFELDLFSANGHRVPDGITCGEFERQVSEMRPAIKFLRWRVKTHDRALKVSRRTPLLRLRRNQM